MNNESAAQRAAEKETVGFRVTMTGQQWRSADLYLQCIQKTKETRQQMLPAEGYGSLRTEIEACLNGRDMGEAVRACVFDEEISILKDCLSVLRIDAIWEEL